MSVPLVLTLETEGQTTNMAGSNRLFTPETWKNWDKSGKAEV